MLLSSTHDTKNRWVEHFSELLNQPTSVNWCVLNYIENNLTIEELDDPITTEEVEEAINNTKLKKSPGRDDISLEILVHGPSP